MKRENKYLKSMNKPIVSSLGQWAYPGKVTLIPDNNITMKGVSYPVLGISNTGDTKMMMPGFNYKFKGDNVTEYPMMQTGGYDYSTFFLNADKYKRGYNKDAMLQLDKYWSARGLNENQRKALMYNVLIESQGGKYLDAHGNGYYGLLGFEPRRYDLIKNKSLEGQAEYIYDTLKNGGGGLHWTDGGKSSGYQSWKNAYDIFWNPNSTYEDINRALIYGYIRPGNREKRLSDGNNYYQTGGIHINPENRGKFTAAAKRAGKSVQEYARQILANKENYSPILIKRANFARNSAKFKHQEGGTSNKYYDFIEWYYPILEKTLKENYYDYDDNIMKNLLFQTAFESYYGEKTQGNNTNLWGIREPYKTEYQTFPSIEDGTKYFIYQIYNNYPKAWNAQNITDYSHGLANGKNGRKYMSADPDKYMQNMNSFQREYDRYIQNRNKKRENENVKGKYIGDAQNGGVLNKYLEGSYIQPIGVQNVMNDYNTAMAKALSKGDYWANVAGVIGSAASSMDIAGGSFGRQKKEDNQNQQENKNQQGGNNAVVMEKNELLNQDGLIFKVLGKKHESASDNIMNNGKIDGVKIQLGNNALQTLKLNPNLVLKTPKRRINKYIAQMDKNEFVVPSTVNEYGYNERKTKNGKFPQAIMENKYL